MGGQGDAEGCYVYNLVFCFLQRFEVNVFVPIECHSRAVRLYPLHLGLYRALGISVSGLIIAVSDIRFEGCEGGYGRRQVGGR